MRAYLWVTDDILNQIRTLNPDGNDKIKKAQEIVDRIYRRDFYKVIGEKRVKWRDESKSLPVQCSYCNKGYNVVKLGIAFIVINAVLINSGY